MYYLLLFILYPLSLLPLRILYIFSDGVYALLYYVVGYRRQVVAENLRHAFPEMTEEELEKTAKKFYRSFCDQWIETLKLLSISEKELNRRFKCNWGVFEQLYDEGKNSYALLGHTFNWEWANVAWQYNCKQRFVVVYNPPTSKATDRLMLRIRTSSGSLPLSMKAKRGFERLAGTHYIVGLVADQNPPLLNTASWYTFMNREAPFFNGPEKLARRAKAAVVFAGIRKIKRGYYEMTLSKLTDDAATLPAGDVMQSYVHFVEEQIKSQPENWMWTHKRWKHKR